MTYPKHCLLFLFAFAASTLFAEPNWKSLIQKDLSNWEQVGGRANYTLNDKIITGAAVPNSPNSFLVTKASYDNFILEFEIFVNTPLNSGVQIRSTVDPTYRNGVFHGYQVEIDPSTRGWSGGIYDEQRRGWLYPLSRNPSASSALKSGEWNMVRIQAIGSNISTWINGVQCARLVDNLTASGKIGLQVHSIDVLSGLEGAQVKWKNIRILTNDLQAQQWVSNPQVKEISFLVNELTDWEKRNGFRLLWDGQTSKGWRGAKLDAFPAKGWQMAGGGLTILKTDGKEATGPGDIVTTDQFTDFELLLEFRITAGANSGIKYFVDPELNKGEGSAIGCEFQILDDAVHPDAKLGVSGNRTIGSLYDLIAAKNLSVPGRPKQFKGIGQWNHVRILSQGGRVEHWLNNEKVVEYDRFSQTFAALVAYSKYAKWEKFGRLQAGSILLQDHGDEVTYRSIKIRELNGRL